MFGFTTGKYKRALQKAMSDCFEPLKDELGTVPTTLHTSKYITASMLGICEAYAQANNVTNRQKIALITDSVFEEVFRRESTSILTQVDQWLKSNDDEFILAYEQAKTNSNKPDLDLAWLQEYAVKHFEPSRNLML